MGGWGLGGVGRCHDKSHVHNLIHNSNTNWGHGVWSLSWQSGLCARPISQHDTSFQYTNINSLESQNKTLLQTISIYFHGNRYNIQRRHTHLHYWLKCIHTKQVERWKTQKCKGQYWGEKKTLAYKCRAAWAGHKSAKGIVGKIIGEKRNICLQIPGSKSWTH